MTIADRDVMATLAPEVGSIVIAVASAGWVFVGQVGNGAPEYLLLEQASVIRLWGTTRGLGELSMTGPTQGTLLDPVGCVWISRPTHLLFLLPCDRQRWNGKL